MTMLTEIHVSQILPASAYQLVGTNSSATKDIYLSIIGTTDQVIVTNSGTSITLSTPQNIDSTASPSFAGITLTGTITATNQTMTLKNIVLTGVTSDPGSPTAGQVWFRSDTSQFVGYNGTTKVIIG